MENNNSNSTNKLNFNDIYRIFNPILVEKDFKKKKPTFNNCLTEQYLKEKIKQNELYLDEAKSILNITKILKIILTVATKSEPHKATDGLVIQLAGICLSGNVYSLIEDISIEQNISPTEFTTDLLSKINYLAVTEPEIFASKKVTTKNKIK